MTQDPSKFVNEAFRRYYSRPEVKASLVVPSIEQREFGFGVESKIDFRHRAFQSQRELEEYLVRETPLYCSFSTARYTLPAAKPMSKKMRQGGDIAFDLDTIYSEEHAERHSPIACSLCLERSREDALRFYEEFLLGDFGFSKSEVTINYSGSKGFHFHVRGEEVQQFSSSARKQLCDYAAAFEVDASTIFREQVQGNKNLLFGPSSTSRGWKGKVYAYLHGLLSTLEPDKLVEAGFPKRLANKVAKDRPFILNSIALGDWTFAASEHDSLNAVMAGLVRTRRVELDKPVSFDNARLIRLPNSLHGDTGFAAAKVEPGVFGAFEPLNDAVVLSGDPVAIIPSISWMVDLQKTTFDLVEGKRFEAPVALAVLLLRKGKAALAD